MILYKDILLKLALAGYTPTRMRREKLLPEGTMQRIREGKPVTTTTLDAICRILNCQIEDIVCYVPDEERGE